MATETVKTLRFDIETSTGNSAEKVTALMEKLKGLNVTLRDYAISQTSVIDGTTEYNNSILVSAGSVGKLKEAYIEAGIALGKFNREVGEKRGEELFSATPDGYYYNRIIQEVTRGYSEAGRKQSEVFKDISKVFINDLNLRMSEEARIILNGENNKLTIQRQYANYSKAVMTDLSQTLTAITKEIARATDPDAYMAKANKDLDKAVAMAARQLTTAQKLAAEAISEQEQIKHNLATAKQYLNEYVKDYRDEMDEEIAIAKAGAKTIYGIELQRKADIIRIRKETDRAIKEKLTEVTVAGTNIAPGTLANQQLIDIATLGRQKEDIANRAANASRDIIEQEQKEYTRREELFQQFTKDQDKLAESYFRILKADAKKGHSDLEAAEYAFQEKLLEINSTFAQRRAAIEQTYLASDKNRDNALNRLLQLETSRKNKAIETAYEVVTAYKAEERALQRLVQETETANKQAVSDLTDRMALELARYREGIAGKKYIILKLTQEEKALKKALAAELEALETSVANKTLASTAEVEAKRLNIITRYEGQIREVMSRIAAVEPNAEKVNAYNMSLLQSISHYTRVYLIMGAIYKLSNEFNKVLDDIPKAGIELEATVASLQATMGSATETGLQLRNLTEEAKRTGIPLKELRENFRNFAASTTMAGESVDTTWKIFKDMNTAMTTLHMSGDKTSHTFLALAQMFNKGKIQSEELVKQLSNYLPGAFASFAAATGRTTLQLSEDMKKGTVQAHEEMAKFADFMAKRFGGDAFTQARTGLNATIGDFQTAVLRLEETVFKGFEGTGKHLLQTITAFIDKAREGTENTYQFSEAIGKLKGGLEALIMLAAGAAFAELIVRLRSLGTVALPIAAAVGGLSTLYVKLTELETPVETLIDNISKLQALPQTESELKRIDLVAREIALKQDLVEINKNLSEITQKPIEAEVKAHKFLEEYKKLNYSLQIAGQDLNKTTLAITDKSNYNEVYAKFFSEAKNIILKELDKTSEAIKTYKSTAPGEDSALFATLGISDKDMAAFTKTIRAKYESAKKTLNAEATAFIERQKAVIAEAEAVQGVSGGKSIEEVKAIRETALNAIYAKRSEVLEKQKDLLQELTEQEAELGMQVRENVGDILTELPKAVKQAEFGSARDIGTTLSKALRENLVNVKSGAIGPMQVFAGAFSETVGENNVKHTVEEYKSLKDAMIEISKRTTDELSQEDQRRIGILESAGKQYLAKQLEHFKNAELAVLAYHDGPGAVSGYIRKLGIDEARITNEQVKQILAQGSAEGQAEVAKVKQTLLKTLTLSKQERDELAFSSEIKARDSEVEATRAELAKNLAESAKQATVAEMERSKFIQNNALKIDEQINQLLGLPTKAVDSWKRATKDTEIAIAVAAQSSIAGEKEKASIMQSQIDLGSKLVEIKDREIAAQTKLNRAMRQLQLGQRSITAREKGGQLSTWDAMDARSKINEREMQTLQAQIDNTTQKVTSTFWETGVITEGMQADIDRTTEWRAQLEELKLTGNEVANFTRTTLTAAFSGSFQGFITGAKTAEEAMKSFATSVLDSAMQLLANKVAMMFLSSIAGIPGLPTGIANFLAPTPSAKGNIVSEGNIQPFAKGGIVSTPTLFPLKRGTGLMGEAGPEAIIPLKRDKQGNLGIAGTSGNSYNTVNNISVSIQKYTGKDDPEQVASKIAEAIARKIAKEEIATASKKGNRLNPIGAF